MKKYHVALSFAGEDREYVDEKTQGQSPSFFNSKSQGYPTYVSLTILENPRIWIERMAKGERFNAPVAQFCQSIGCSPMTSYTQWKRKLAAKP